MISFANENGKISAAAIREAHAAETYWGRHATAPKVVSISQPTEFGTVYSLEELTEIRRTCDELNMYLHMDGCRLYNAASALGCSLARLAAFADILCLGGTKAGLMFGEAMVFMNQALAHDFDRRQKLGMQLMSKTRFVSAQFLALFTDDLGLKAAAHANALLQRLWQGLQEMGCAEAVYPVQSNQLFVKIPESVIEPLQQAYPFYVYNKALNHTRLIASHDNTPEQVDDFLAMFRTLIASSK